MREFLFDHDCDGRSNSNPAPMSDTFNDWAQKLSSWARQENVEVSIASSTSSADAPFAFVKRTSIVRDAITPKDFVSDRFGAWTYGPFADAARAQKFDWPYVLCAATAALGVKSAAADAKDFFSPDCSSSHKVTPSQFVQALNPPPSQSPRLTIRHLRLDSALDCALPSSRKSTPRTSSQKPPPPQQSYGSPVVTTRHSNSKTSPTIVAIPPPLPSRAGRFQPHPPSLALPLSEGSNASPRMRRRGSPDAPKEKRTRAVEMAFVTPAPMAPRTPRARSWQKLHLAAAEGSRGGGLAGGGGKGPSGGTIRFGRNEGLCGWDADSMRVRKV
jgi:hypothetical protein